MPRKSVTAEAYGKWNKPKPFQKKIVPKSHEQKMAIREKLISCFMFSSVEENELEIIVNAMEEFKAIPDQIVIKEGDPGNCLYVVDSGRLVCTKIFVFLNSYLEK